MLLLLHDEVQREPLFVQQTSYQEYLKGTKIKINVYRKCLHVKLRMSSLCKIPKSPFSTSSKFINWNYQC